MEKNIVCSNFVPTSTLNIGRYAPRYCKVLLNINLLKLKLIADRKVSRKMYKKVRNSDRFMSSCV